MLENNQSFKHLPLGTEFPREVSESGAWNERKVGKREREVFSVVVIVTETFSEQSGLFENRAGKQDVC